MSTAPTCEMYADYRAGVACTREATGYVHLGGAGDWAGWACAEHGGPSVHDPIPRPSTVVESITGRDFARCETCGIPVTRNHSYDDERRGVTPRETPWRHRPNGPERLGPRPDPAGSIGAT